MYLTVPDLSDMAPRFTSTMSPTATCATQAHCRCSQLVKGYKYHNAACWDMDKTQRSA